MGKRRDLSHRKSYKGCQSIYHWSNPRGINQSEIGYTFKLIILFTLIIGKIYYKIIYSFPHFNTTFIAVKDENGLVKDINIF